MNQITPNNIEGYLKRNWFQIGILVIILISVFRNDSVETVQDNSIQLADSSDNQNSKTQKETMGFGFSIPGSSAKKKAPAVEKNTLKGEEFITRYANLAKEEAKKFEVPASVMLALGLYHRNSPKTHLAQKANNYFAIPCTSDWYGASITHEDACYRSYKSAWFSFRDQNNYLNQLKEKGMEQMKNGLYLTIGDWARLLKRNGLIKSTSKFEQLVFSFDLTRFDEI